MKNVFAGIFASALVVGGLVCALILAFNIFFNRGISYSLYNLIMGGSSNLPSLVEFMAFTAIDIIAIAYLSWRVFTSKLCDVVKSIQLSFIISYMFVLVLLGSWYGYDVLPGTSTPFLINYAMIIIGTVSLVRYFKKHQLSWHYYFVSIFLSFVLAFANFGFWMGSG